MSALPPTSSLHSSPTGQASSLPTPPSIISHPWFLSIFTPLRGSRIQLPGTEILERWKVQSGGGAHSQEVEGIILIVLVDPPTTHTHYVPATQDFPWPLNTPSSFLPRGLCTCCSLWYAQLRSPYGRLLLILFLAQISPSQKTFPGHPAVILCNIILWVL